MIFDYKAYSRLLNEFIIEGEKIEQNRDPAFNKILEPICKFLRISRISSAVFDSTCDSAIIKSDPHIYSSFKGMRVLEKTIVPRL